MEWERVSYGISQFEYRCGTHFFRLSTKENIGSIWECLLREVSTPMSIHLLARFCGAVQTVIEHLIGRIDDVLSAKMLILYYLYFYPFFMLVFDNRPVSYWCSILLV
jgi:hypothetical protein